MGPLGFSVPIVMARLPRLVVPHLPHHVLQKGNGGQQVFVDEEDHHAFLEWLRLAARQFKVAIHAYALMPGQMHLLATPADGTGLSRMMQWVGRHYVPYFNRKHGRTGTLWEGRYRATVVEPRTCFMLSSCYIETHPVRAGLAATPADYPWSSYPHHAGIRSDPMITDHAMYWALGNTPFDREAAYRARIEQGLGSQEIAMLTDAVLKGWAIGSSQFKADLEKESKRRVQPAKRGRPSKTAALQK